MVTLESLKSEVDFLSEQLNDVMRLIYQLHARTALNSPEKRLVVGIANRVALEKMELGDNYDEEIFYKHSKKKHCVSKLRIDTEEDISQAQFLCWHLLHTLGGLTQEEISVEYGYSSHFKHTANKIREMNKTVTGRAIIKGAESRFEEEFQRCLIP